MTRQKSLTVEISYLLDLLTIYNMPLFYFEKMTNLTSDTFDYLYLGQLSAIKLAIKSILL